MRRDCDLWGLRRLRMESVRRDGSEDVDEDVSDSESEPVAKGAAESPAVVSEASEEDSESDESGSDGAPLAVDSSKKLTDRLRCGARVGRVVVEPRWRVREAGAGRSGSAVGGGADAWGSLEVSGLSRIHSS